MVNVAAPLVLEAFYDAAQAEFGTGVEVALGSFVVDPVYGYTYLGVGLSASDESETQSMSFGQSWASVTGPSRDEEGTIRFAVLAMVGDAGNEGALAAMQAVFDIAETLGGTIREGLSIPVSVMQWTDPLMDAEFSLAQTTQGAEALLRFGIGYKARI